MSEFDRIIVESLTQDLGKAKSTKERKEIIAELNAIKEKQRNAMLIKLGVVAFILLIVVNAIYSKVSDVNMSTIQTASWYQE